LAQPTKMVRSPFSCMWPAPTPHLVRPQPKPPSPNEDALTHFRFHREEAPRCPAASLPLFNLAPLQLSTTPPHPCAMCMTPPPLPWSLSSYILLRLNQPIKAINGFNVDRFRPCRWPPLSNVRKTPIKAPEILDVSLHLTECSSPYLSLTQMSSGHPRRHHVVVPPPPTELPSPSPATCDDHQRAPGPDHPHICEPPSSPPPRSMTHHTCTQFTSRAPGTLIFPLEN
jgi:hypothetical protein